VTAICTTCFSCYYLSIPHIWLYGNCFWEWTYFVSTTPRGMSVTQMWSFCSSLEGINR